MNISPMPPEILFHGSAIRFKRIDVSKGRAHKDFGKGFYMAVDVDQAIGMMHKKYRESIGRRPDRSNGDLRETLYRIRIDSGLLPSLKVKVFDRADRNWLDFILLCRPSEGVPHDYDVVIGPTADDDTNRALKFYYDGTYGDPDSEKAKDFLLGVLEVDKLGRQMFIARQSVADRLVVEMEELDWRLLK